MLCSRCAREIPEGALFCPWCGKRQSGAAPAQRRKRRPWAAVTGTGKLLGTFATSGEAVAALDA